MKKSTVLWSLVLSAALLFVSACDLTEFNEDPNNPLDVPENLLLSGLLSNFSYEIVANQATRIPVQFVQQLAWAGDQPSFTTYDVDENDINNLWEFWAYTDVLNSARDLVLKAEENGNRSYAGIAKVIQAWTFSILTDLWGDVPLSEAFDPSNFSPAYDTQEQVYQEVFRLLDEAAADLQGASTLTPGTDDLLYGGDLEKWHRLAFALKARFSLRLSRAPGYSEAAQAQKALDALQQAFQSNADDADFAYFATSGAENPWYQFVIDGKWDTRDQLSAYYVNLLKTLRDPRLPVHARQVGAVGSNGLVAGFTPVPFTEAHFDLADATYQGQPSDQDGLGALNNSSIGPFFSAANAPLTWIDYASTLFVKAEATLITQGAGAAQPVYEAAIRADMEKLNVPQERIDAYIASLPTLAAAANPLQELHTQKYIANFLHLEAYNDWRRVGFPELQPVATADAKVDLIPLRFPYPGSELTRNAASIPNYVPIGFTSMKVPVWWDTTVPPGALPNPTQQ